MGGVLILYAHVSSEVVLSTCSSGQFITPTSSAENPHAVLIYAVYLLPPVRWIPEHEDRV